MIELGEAAVPWPMVEDRHGRKVVQTARVIPAAGHIDTTDWPACKSIGVIDSWRKVGDKAGTMGSGVITSVRAIWMVRRWGVRYARTGASKPAALGAGCRIWRGCQHGAQGITPQNRRY